MYSDQSNQKLSRSLVVTVMCEYKLAVCEDCLIWITLVTSIVREEVYTLIQVRNKEDVLHIVHFNYPGCLFIIFSYPPTLLQVLESEKEQTQNALLKLEQENNQLSNTCKVGSLCRISAFYYNALRVQGCQNALVTSFASSNSPVKRLLLGADQKKCDLHCFLYILSENNTSNSTSVLFYNLGNSMNVVMWECNLQWCDGHMMMMITVHIDCLNSYPIFLVQRQCP